MKILEIKDGKGFFWDFNNEDWRPIDEIDKKALMKMLEMFLEEDVEMDIIEENNISNQAHLIIYKSIFEKLSGLERNKSKFKDESQRKYFDAIQKYSEA